MGNLLHKEGKPQVRLAKQRHHSLHQHTGPWYLSRVSIAETSSEGPVKQTNHREQIRHSNHPENQINSSGMAGRVMKIGAVQCSSDEDKGSRI